MDIGPSRTKWWGPDRHIVIYYTNAARSELYFVTSVPEPAEWVTRESWSAKGDVKELRKAYEGFHADVRAVLEACPDCHKWAILEREPLPRWSDGRVVLLGDACHSMTPYMAQGGATAIEDAAILARCLEEIEGEDIEGAFQRYEAHRKPRTSRIQAISSANTWMKGGDEDTSWLYGYDAWNVPLTPIGTIRQGSSEKNIDGKRNPKENFYDFRQLRHRLYAAPRSKARRARDWCSSIPWRSMAASGTASRRNWPARPRFSRTTAGDMGNRIGIAEPFTTDQFAGDLAELLDHVGLARSPLSRDARWEAASRRRSPA